MKTIRSIAIAAACAALVAGCSESKNHGQEIVENLLPDTPAAPQLTAGAASNSILPTVNGGREYKSELPQWSVSGGMEPFDPGLFVPAWDQGTIDIGNGADDSAWVHDDLRVSAVAMEYDGQKVIMAMTDTYMQFAADIDAIKQQARGALPEEWRDAPILISATHNHHGPDTGFEVNDDWYQLLADETVSAITAAVNDLEPAVMRAAQGQHLFGTSDQSDPNVLDATLNVIGIDRRSGEPIATLVQWASHPETTLGLKPEDFGVNITEACSIKGWGPENCSAKGRYITADYPGALRHYIQSERGGEVLYFNGAIGDQIGPGGAPIWKVDEAHPLTADNSLPAGAEPLVADCSAQNRDPFYCRTFNRAEAIGNELGKASLALIADAATQDVSEITVREQPYYTRLSNVLFLYLIADGGIGWGDNLRNRLYQCDAKPFTDDNCTPNSELENPNVDDPVVGALMESQIAAGNALKTQLTHVDFGNIGMLYMPGELTAEQVAGLPGDFESNRAAYFESEETSNQHTANYRVPGPILSLPEEPITLTVGLGTDQLGYFIPASDIRLPCTDDIMGMMGTSCQEMFDIGAIDAPEWVGGDTCQTYADDENALASFGTAAPAAMAVCRYGQLVGRVMDDVPGHYEETNSAGWDLADDVWSAAQRLFSQE